MFRLNPVLVLLSAALLSGAVQAAPLVVYLGRTDTLNLKGGVARASSENPQVMDVTLADGSLLLEAKSSGKTVLRIRGRNGSQHTLTVYVVPQGTSLEVIPRRGMAPIAPERPSAGELAKEEGSEEKAPTKAGSPEVASAAHLP
jgi:hypothetical protein